MDRETGRSNSSDGNQNDPWEPASEDDIWELLEDENLSTGVTLGTYRGQRIYQFNEDRMRHTLILGRTGSGKSNLIKQMEREDIRSGAGLFILAAHEEDALYPLACVPEERQDDVVLIDASDPRFLPRINPLDVDASDEAAVSKMIDDVFELVTINMPYEWSGPRFESYLRSGLGLLIDDSPCSDHCIADLKKLYTDPEYTKKVLASCKHKEIYDFWTKSFPESMKSYDAGEVVEWFISKVSRFWSDHVLRTFFGRGRTTIDLVDVVEKGKILIAYVPEDRIGTAAANTVCKWLIMQVRDAIMARLVNRSEGLNYDYFKHGSDGLDPNGENRELEPFFVYVDEFAKFATPDFEVLLAEARKQRVAFVLSTQTLSQTRIYDRKEQRGSRLEDVVLGNVGTVIAYQLGLGDATRLAEQFDVPVEDYKRIRRYRPLSSICMDNAIRRPIELEVPLRPDPDDSDAPRNIANRMKAIGAWVSADRAIVR